MENFTFRFNRSKFKSNPISLWILACFFILGNSQFFYGQTVPLGTTVHANFGVDADVHSGLLSFDTMAQDPFGTDDWVEGVSGQGVIDETMAATIQQLQNGENIQAEFRMSQPINYVDPAGNTWLDAVYLRDQNTKGGNKDLTVFGAGADKNFDDPNTWDVKEGDVPQKNDLIDVYAHFRRGAGFPSDPFLWAFLAASTRSDDG
ncbi:MAG: hypothetical protein KJO77_09795, partial [Bacteroidia bacterium]|nr:hypothetical protein [Bacteroidia bacterium]